jgi:hypothetical protein
MRLDCNKATRIACQGNVSLLYLHSSFGSCKQLLAAVKSFQTVAMLVLPPPWLVCVQGAYGTEALAVVWPYTDGLYSQAGDAFFYCQQKVTFCNRDGYKAVTVTRLAVPLPCEVTSIS